MRARTAITDQNFNDLPPCIRKLNAFRCVATTCNFSKLLNADTTCTDGTNNIWLSVYKTFADYKDVCIMRSKQSRPYRNDIITMVDPGFSMPIKEANYPRKTCVLGITLKNIDMPEDTANACRYPLFYLFIAPHKPLQLYVYKPLWDNAEVKTLYAYISHLIAACNGQSEQHTDFIEILLTYIDKPYGFGGNNQVAITWYSDIFLELQELARDYTEPAGDIFTLINYDDRVLACRMKPDMLTQIIVTQGTTRRFLEAPLDSNQPESYYAHVDLNTSSLEPQAIA